MLQFRPALIPTITVVLLAPTFVGLGLWQVERAQQKRGVAKLQDSRRKQPAVNLNNLSAAFETVEFRTLTATGTFDSELQILLENRRHQSKTGYHVITPLKIDSSNRYLLVNRGWVGQVSDITTPAVNQKVTLSGTANLPQEPALVLDDSIPMAEQTIWPYLTIERYRHWSKLDLYPFVLLLSADSPHGFVRQWPNKRPSDAMHIGYAIQWFAFAIIVLAIWLKLSLNSESSQKDDGA